MDGGMDMRKGRGAWRRAAALILAAILCCQAAAPISRLTVSAAQCGGNVTQKTCPGHGHNMTVYSKCSTCAGKGYWVESTPFVWVYGCTSCGGSGREDYHGEGNFVQGKGINRRCTNGTGCAYSSWNYHRSVSGVCYYCGGCENVYGEHANENAYRYDGYYHWLVCRFCGGNQNSTGAHSMGGKWLDSAAGYYKQSCVVCGYAKLCGRAYAMTVCHVTYDSNTSTWDPAFLTQSYTVEEGSVFNASFTAPPTGYEIWDRTDKNWTVTGNRTFYCMYTPKTVTVTFYRNAYSGDATKAVQIFTYGKAGQRFSEKGWSRTGYTQGLWDGEYGIVSSVSNSWINAYSPSVSLYAQWIPNQYQVSFQSDGGTAVASKTVTYDAGYGSLASPSKEGFTFLGWYLGNLRVQSSTKVQTANDHTLTAKWQRNQYTVTYDVNGGKGVSQSEGRAYYDYDVNLGVSAEPPEGKVFVGWGLQADSKRALTGHRMPAGDVTLYALYSVPTSGVREVYLRVTGVSEATGQKDTRIYRLNKNKTFQATGFYEIPKLDYSVGFRKDSSLTAAIYGVDNAGNERKLQDIKAQSAPTYYTQTVEHWLYNQRSGNHDILADRVDSRVEAGQTFTPSCLSPIPSGYHVSTERVTDLSACRVTGDRTWKVYYDVDRYTLTYDANGGQMEDGSSTAEREISYGEEYGVGPTPEREGHAFLGWHTGRSGGDLVRASDSYQRKESQTLYAHWQVGSYTVTYDYWTNGGSGAALASDTVKYQDAVNVSVAAWKEGWAHLGWSLRAEVTQPLSSFRMPARNTTLYAIFRKKPVVQYDYWTNGGAVKAGTEKEYVRVHEANTDALLSLTAEKEGFRFAGWNTDPKAGEGLKRVPLGWEDVTLYAIYQRDVTVTYVDYDGQNTRSRADTRRICNQATAASFQLPELLSWDGWEMLGWCRGTEADAPVSVACQAAFETYEDVAFYGKYRTWVKVSYDTGLSEDEFPAETKERIYNASGAYKNPQFQLAAAPALEGYSFVCWRDPQGVAHSAEEELELLESAVFIAVWDKYPEIEAYDRYFTLEDAKGGMITQNVLLEKVKGTDLEDGALINGRDVTVLNYRAEDFTGLEEDGEVAVAYQAKDSFGNTVRKQVTAHIVDTLPEEHHRRSYVRFIGEAFYQGEGWSLPLSEGGLEETSLWREDAEYRSRLEYALSNQKRQEETVQREFLGKNYEITKPGSGSWLRQVSVWTLENHQLTRSDEP